MSFYIKELFYTIQGEGIQTGRPAVFCRFSGCNLWSGKENDRATARCQFCDTDFLNADYGILESEEQLVENILQTFPQLNTISPSYKPYVVFTGGEPSLQLNQQVITLLHSYHVEIAVETNGTLPLPKQIDWITVSPKEGNTLITISGNELKLVWPQNNCNPNKYLNLAFDNFILQPKDNENLNKNITACIEYCMQHPYWRLGLQSHKTIGIR